MRPIVRPSVAFSLIGGLAAMMGSGQVLAQAADGAAAPAAANGEVTEEITVRGRKTLTQYRLELEEAREELIEVYNQENKSNDNDITCRSERVTGTKIPQRICRSNAQSDAEARSARTFLNSMTMSAGRFTNHPAVGGLTPSANASDAGGPQLAATIGAGDALGSQVAGTADARQRIEEELARLQRENRKVYRAALKYVELQDEYNAAREAGAPE